MPPRKTDRHIERRNQVEQAKLEWLRGAVRKGLEEIDRGEGLEFGSIEELDGYIDQLGVRGCRRDRNEA